MTIKSTLLPAFLLFALVSVAFIACNISGQPCGWLNVSACDPPPPVCSQVLLGLGGGAGFGGDTSGYGAGGGAVGAGGDPSASTVTSAAGTTSGAGAGGGDPGDPQPDPQALTCTDGTELGTYIRCWGLGSTACAAQCNAIGAYCVELATHPVDPQIGIGSLKQCMETLSSFTCTYCYSNKDVCSFVCVSKGICASPGCTNTGGKGCE